MTPFETNRGTRHVWTTFSDDQVDLNFSEPDVLCEMIDVLLFYVARGARTFNFGAAGPYDVSANRVAALRVFVTVE